jgi:hypothetical protein
MVYCPIRGPSRVDKLRKRRKNSKFRIRNVVIVLTGVLFLTVAIPAFPALDKQLFGGIFPVSGQQQLTPQQPPQKTEYAIVYISGAVANPGVIKVPAGTTVADIVDMAGGYAAGADTAKVDLAGTVKDEMHIHIDKVVKATAPPAKKK